MSSLPEVYLLTTVEFEDLLTPESLSTLMRSTWTWDDRALRRDLAALLVELAAARDATSSPHAETLSARALSAATEFVAAVLGPKLMADAGNPLQERFLDDAIDPARFARAASSAFMRVHTDIDHYLSSHIDQTYYPPESSWYPDVVSSGTIGLASAMRAYGNTLCDSGFYASMGLAWQTLQAVRSESPKAGEFAERLEKGAISATLAVAEQSGSWDPALVRTKAAPGPDGWQITGLKQFVPAADSADIYFVIARSLAGPSLFGVYRSAPGLEVTALDVVDPTRPLFGVAFADTPAVLIGTEGGGGALMAKVIDFATNALAAEQVGLIEKSIAMLAGQSVEPSRIAELTLDHAAAVALGRRALAEDASASPVASSAAAAAHIGCSKASVRAATTTAALLGPSAETTAVLRRALSASLLFGGPAVYYERLLERLGV